VTKRIAKAVGLVRPLRKKPLPKDPHESAKAAHCHYVDDTKPGIRRVKSGKGFRFVSPDGKTVRDADTLRRIRSLVIPPAWTNVWICVDPDGHIQATGRDARGRKQYRYHPRFREIREETKYERMMAFAEALPAIRAKVDEDLGAHGLTRDKVLATVVRLLEITLIRVGNEEYARENGSFGLTTMRTRHVDISGSTIGFHFRGKSGKEHQVKIHDRRLARTLQRCNDLPGEVLFQYIGEDGERHTVESADVNEYIRRIAGAEFTAKDFRTWAGTVLAAQALKELAKFDTKAVAKKNIVAAVKSVSGRLGNTPTVWQVLRAPPDLRCVPRRSPRPDAAAARRGRAPREPREALLRRGCGAHAPPRPARRKAPLRDRRRRGASPLEGGVMAAADIRIGISGWRYGPWRGVFYPKGLGQKNELHFASRMMRSVEINGSFYSLQRPSSYLCWYHETPDDFVFAVKGARFITHNKKLRDCAPPLANFFASGVLALENKLGPILWQLPPQLSFSAERLEAFFDILPRTTSAAAEIARNHDHRIKYGAYLDIKEDRPLRYALEVRHETFDDPAFVKVLRKHDIALCVADTAGKWPYLEDVTSDFVYVRLHGEKKLYVSGYDRSSLDCWADRVRAWSTGSQPDDPELAAPGTKPKAKKHRDVYVYFDNDVKVRAPYDAMNLAARLGQGELVTFPRKAQRAAEATRGVENPLSNWDRWRFTPVAKRSA